jgi:hypothetical protein
LQRVLRWEEHNEYYLHMVLSKQSVLSLQAYKILYNNNNSIQFFIIYVPSQQLQGQLQTQHSVGTNNNIMSKLNIKSKFN